MHFRLFVVFFVLLSIESALAANEEWMCEEAGKDGWSCGDGAQELNNKMTLALFEEEGSFETLPSQPSSLAEAKLVKTEPISATPPQNVNNNELGWNCFANEGDETWNCSLTGSDPKGQTKNIEENKSSFNLFLDAFDFNQEQNFERLQSRLKYDPWENCETSSERGQFPHELIKDSRNTAPMSVKADYSEVFDKEITSFFGNVEISRADQQVTAEKASYDTVSETMDAQGHIFYTENELSLHSDTALLNLATDEARLRNALFISPSGPIRGSANVVYRDSNVLSRYTNAVFTSCRPGNQDWAIHANRLKMNRYTGKGSAKHAWLEFKGIPIVYTPYIAFPLDDRRTTGLLTPSFGSSDESGFDVTIPYYWNIAPNYDLTVWPRYMSKRGGMIGGEFRYLTEITKKFKTRGSLGLEYLPYDLLRDESRYSGTFRNRTQFTSRLSSDMDLNYVSDKEYFDELNNALGLSNDRYLQSQANLTYNQEGVYFNAHAESYQTIDKDVVDAEKPYYKLPQVTLNLDHSFDQWPIEIAMENEYVNFYRKGRVSGHRINLKPSVSAPLEVEGAYIEPKISLQYTQYFLNDRLDGKANNISRTLPILSVDSGLFFEKDFNFADSDYIHTIEPRLFYLYIPKKDQQDIPTFDSALYDFGYSALFRENRFSGSDRVQDANQITMALTTRLLDAQTGQEKLKLSIGEIFYFRDREVTLSGVPETYQWSNLVAEVSGKLTDHWSISSAIQWNPEANDISRGQAEIRYRNLPGQIINLGYRYRRDDQNTSASVIQTDASFRWPLYDNWFGVGRWQYSLKFNSTKESFLGLEKESCCWRFRVVWRRFANTLSDNSTDEMDEGIFVQMELKGLAGFGDKVDEFLERNLKGYQRVK